MKHKSRILIYIFILLISGFEARAVHTVTHPELPETSRLSSITVGQFLAIDFAKLDKEKKLNTNWLQRKLLRMEQIRLEKKVAKGKLEKNAALYSKAAGSNPNKRGLLSTIFGGAAFLFGFIPVAGLLALPLAIVGLILGIKGLKRDADNTLSIVGIVLCSVFLFLFLLAIVVLASFFSIF
jgi:hypothetical protein